MLPRASATTSIIIPCHGLADSEPALVACETSVALLRESRTGACQMLEVGYRDGYGP